MKMKYYTLFIFLKLTRGKIFVSRFLTFGLLNLYGYILIIDLYFFLYKTVTIYFIEQYKRFGGIKNTYNNINKMFKFNGKKVNNNKKIKNYNII